MLAPVRCGRNEAREKALIGVIETDDVEAVAGVKPRDGKCECFTRLTYRIARHRTRVVDHEDDFAVRFLTIVDRGRGEEGHEIHLAVHHLSEKACRWNCTRGRRPLHGEITVGGNTARLETIGPAAVGIIGLLHLVIGCFDVADREAGIEVHRQGDRIDLRILARIQHRGFDLLAIRHRVGDRKAAATLEVDSLNNRVGIVAGGNDHWEAEREGAITHADGFLILDLNHHRFARSDIGDLIGEDVGPLLFEKGGLLAFRLGLFVNVSSFLSRLDLAFDQSFPDLHLQPVDGGILRQRKNIGAFHPAVRRVFEPLGDFRP